MRRIIFVLLFCALLSVQVYAAEWTAPEVPDSGATLMPRADRNFGEGIAEILRNVLPLFRPDLAEAARVSGALLASALMVSILQAFSAPTGKLCDLVGSVTVAALLFRSAHSMIQLGMQNILELSEYEKLLLPVQTAAIAAQGGAGTAASLYAGTALFNTLLSSLICKWILPMIYLFLALAVACGCQEEEVLGKIKELLKNTIHWVLKTLISSFTAYMGITRVVSGSVDAAALKATKTALTTVIPVVGGILSEASEAVLAGAALAKNAIGVYGIYAILAVFAGPYIRIGTHYLVLKYTSAICSILGPKKMAGVMDDFSTAMRLILAATGTMCILLLISSICFLKGVG